MKYVSTSCALYVRRILAAAAGLVPVWAVQGHSGWHVRVDQIARRLAKERIASTLRLAAGVVGSA